MCQHPEKIRYWSERAAKKALRSIVNVGRDGAEPLHVYRCGDHLHIGHNRNPKPLKAPGRKARR